MGDSDTCSSNTEDKSQCAESGVEDLMYLLESSDGWGDDNDWHEYVKLPDESLYKELPDEVPNDSEKCLRRHFLSQKYSNGICKFEMVFEKGWVIKRLCPCARKNCGTHFDGTDKIRPVRDWHKICKFPEGHKLSGCVREGQEMEKLQKIYKENYTITQDGDKYEVKQICPCGKTQCDVHIIPSTVELEHSFDLVTIQHKTKTTPKVVTPIEPLFRKQQPMTFDQVRKFFEQFQLNWNVFVTAMKITFWMVCKCGEAFEHTPCQPCAMRKVRKCHLCGEQRRSRMLKKCHPSKNCKCKGICSDCKAAEISFCEFCKKDVRLDHVCAPLVRQHVQFRKRSIYPDFIRSEGANSGYCGDCKKPMARRIYSRHQYRQHNDLKPCALYSRNYDRHDCPYCWYYHYDSTNVRNHINSIHSLKKTFACKLGCGMRFTHACSEISHRRKVHKQAAPTLKRNRRVGRRIVLVEKKRKTDPEPSVCQTQDDSAHMELNLFE